MECDHHAGATLQVTLHLGTDVLVRTIGDTTYPDRTCQAARPTPSQCVEPAHHVVPKRSPCASTYWYLGTESPAFDDAPMKKRSLASALWFFAGWYGGAVLAWVVGIEAPMGLLVGIAAAAFVWVDPVHLLWNPSAAKSRARLEATTAASAMPGVEPERVA